MPARRSPSPGPRRISGWWRAWTSSFPRTAGDRSIRWPNARPSGRDASGNLGSDVASFIIFDVLDVRVSAGSDDAEESSSGSVSRGSSDLDIASSAVGLRLQGVALPQGAIVRSAYVRFTADRSRATATRVTVYGEASDAAGTFLSRSKNVSSRPATASSVLREPEPWSSAQIHVTPELSAVVQEIVDRTGWTPGNALALVVSFGSGRREAKSFNADPARAPELHVEYTVVR